MKPIPYGKQWIDESDIKRVVSVLRSDWISSGPTIQAFEEKLARYCGAKYAVAVSSGTSALHLACLAAGLKKGKEAITTAITFLATANSVLYAGAKPVFADIDYETVNICTDSIKKLINKKTRAILPVHFAGLPVNSIEIQKIAKKHNLFVIEDGCHALGAEYKGHKVGSCKYADMTCFSFHPVKHITTGEGGAITTNDKKIYERLLSLRNHGTIKTQKLMEKVGGWYAPMQELGFNYRITDIQAALGLGQLSKLSRFVKRRQEIAEKYDAGFKGIPEFILPKVHYKDRLHSWHLYLLRLRLPETKLSRRAFYDELRKQGILTQVHYVPVPNQPFYKQYLKKRPKIKNAEMYYKEAISLPMFPKMSDQDVSRVISVVKKVIVNSRG